MQPGRRFLLARGGKSAAGGALRFTLDGYPIPEKIGVWLMVLAGALVFVAGAALYRRELGMNRGRTARSTLLVALRREREGLFEELRDLEERYDAGELSDRRYDVEAARLRERLALVLRSIHKEEQEERR
jgi:hypothetical protein